jgi:hypothetical protein
MRWQNKYKKIDKNHSLDALNYVRIKKFKNTKWKRLKTKFGKKFLRRNILNNQLIHARFSSWYKLKHYFKDSLKIKNRFLSSFQFFKTIKKDGFRKTSSYKKNLINWLILPYFNLSCLLWLLGLCASPYHAQKLVENSFVMLNGFYIKNNTFLEEGDVIHVDSITPLSQNLRRKPLQLFVEIDYYTNTFVILKRPDDLSFSSLSLILNDSANLTQYKNYYR